ncbi:ribonuclease R [Patescibacteria group bacterium]|nr:ribonuclease R [Patescibacteria group bacterium]
MKREDTVYEGPISITRTGKGFFAYDPDKEDLFITGEDLGGAFPGDIVKVVRTGAYADPRTRKARAAGKVLEVVSRTRERFVGKLVQDGGRVLLIPDWKKMYVPFEASGASLPLDHKVVLQFTGWRQGNEFPSGEVIEDIGVAGVHETEMRALALSQGFSSEFPPGVVTDAKKLEETGEAMIAEETKTVIPWNEDRKSQARRDFRLITTFTIDPADAKDFDDALSVRTLPDGKIEVGVHIADVSFFVKPGNTIDAEARARATSVYLVDRTIPMLPHVLSTNFCSLNPDVDRLAMAAVFTLDTEGNVVDRWFGETLIHSDKRFAYEEAQEVLDNGSGTLYEELATIRDLAKKIRVRRVAKGAIEFDTPEVKIELDAEGKPIAVRLKERKETNLLIEDFMLLANVAVAEELSSLGKKNGNQPSVYRIHDAPDAERILNLAQFLKVLGYDLNVTPDGRVRGVDLNRLMGEVKGKPEEYLIKTATLRSMSKAIYTTKNVGHFGLAFDHYTHFTSPIRRYPDVLVHRMLKHYVTGDPVSKKEMEDFERLAVHSSEREVSAAEAERDSVKMKQVEFLAGRIGEEFEGVISGVTDRGLYVELNETRADGMVRVSAIGNDYYIYDEKRYRLVGERTKKEYALGDPIKVKLIAARVMERELDFELVP